MEAMGKTMKKQMMACVLHDIGNLQYESVPMPVRADGEVLIKIKASGICGSDVPRVFTKGTYHFPTIPGHEFSGQIMEADDAALVGKKCTVFPLLPCRKCASCESGNYAQCQDYDYFGSRCDGAFAEYISVPIWNVLIAPDELSYEEIAMCEPLAVALHSLEHANLKANNSVAVFGAGPIGVMIGKWAKYKGAGKVYLLDIDPQKIAFAEKLGFETKLEGPVDVCIEGAGVSQTFEQAMFAAKPFGTVVLMGNPAKEMELSQKGYWEILRKELHVCGTWNSSYCNSQNDWNTALQCMRDLDISCLLSHKFSLSQHKEAFDLMKNREEYFSKVMFVL